MKIWSWRKCVVWGALLPVGVLFLFVVRPFQHRYDDRGFGSFHGFAKGDLTTTKEKLMVVSFEGRTEPEWRWGRPSNYRYVDVHFEWVASGGAEGEGLLHLPTMMLKQSNEAVIINREWFLQHCEHESSATECMDLLIAARDGTLPRPRHHYHRFDGAIEGSLAHFSLGWRCPYIILIWLGVWMFLTIFFLFKRKLAG